MGLLARLPASLLPPSQSYRTEGVRKVGTENHEQTEFIQNCIKSIAQPPMNGFKGSS